jgi:DNA-binding NarL/FixJ family response regulator
MKRHLSVGDYGGYSPFPRQLTPRMIDIAEQIVSGNATTRGIAEALKIRPQTVKNILNIIYARLGVESRIDLVVKHRDGLIAIDRRRSS